MSRILFGYGSLRSAALRNRKIVGSLILLGLIGALYMHTHNGELSEIRSKDEGSDLIQTLSALQKFGKEAIQKLAIGETGLAPLDVNRVVENLEELEEIALAEASAAMNESVLDNSPVFDKNGNEIGLRFFVLSDWGGQPVAPYTTNTQMKVSRAMDELASKYDCSFVLSLGDNFCDSGVKSVDDLRFEDTWEDVFTQPSLKIPWYVIAGDADYRGNVSAQIAYSERSSRWSFTKEYYKMSAELSTFKNVSVDFILIDTVQLCGRLPPSGMTQPMGPDNHTEAEEQWNWIKRTLKHSDAEYLIVAGHYPVYSGGRHGSTKCLVDRLAPMLKQYHVSAYFGGHDHSVQHIKSTGGWVVHHFVAGAASDEDDRPDHLDGIYSTTRYFWTNHLDKSTGAFAYCDVRKDKMSVAFVHSDNTLLYTTDVLPRSHPSNHQSATAHVTDDVVKIPVIKHHHANPINKPKSQPLVLTLKQNQAQPLQFLPKPRQQLLEEEQNKPQPQLPPRLQQQLTKRNYPDLQHNRFRRP